MKMSFWQKTYLFTLLLFLFCLNAGILSLTVYTYRKNVEATEAATTAEQYYVAMSFEHDYNALMETGENVSLSLLMQSFGAHYGNKGLFIAFEKDGETLYSNFPYEYEAAYDSLVHSDFDGERYILISSSLCDDELDMIFAKNVSSLDSEFRALMLTYAVTALGVSLFLAVCLYFILKTLSVSLEKLRKTTETIESGDFSVTADESGHDEFSLLAKSFNSMLAKIHEQMEALEMNAERKQMLVDNMAHELRTPLTSIRGYAEFLEKAAATEEKRIIAAKYILSESERLQKISEILLDSAYIRGNEPDMEELDLSEILTDVADKLQIKAEGSGVELICETEETKISGNETLLSMLFYNLTENAIKACLTGGSVRLHCSEAAVIIEDNGKGMTEEQLTHITEPFYRTDKSRSRAEGGAGLGLALCKQIVETHGAVMRFESEIGVGTKITVSFTSRK